MKESYYLFSYLHLGFLKALKLNSLLIICVYVCGICIGLYGCVHMTRRVHVQCLHLCMEARYLCWLSSIALHLIVFLLKNYLQSVCLSVYLSSICLSDYSLSPVFLAYNHLSIYQYIYHHHLFSVCICEEVKVCLCVYVCDIYSCLCDCLHKEASRKFWVGSPFLLMSTLFL